MANINPSYNVNNWKGYLFKSIKTGEKFPLKYIAFESWESTPNQREELKAYREEYTRTLYRVTAPGKMSTFSFTTRDNLHLADKMAIQKFFYDGENGQTAHDQKTIQLEYWDEENNTYQTGYFYQPNLTFGIRRVEEHDIIYKEQKLEFIQAE